MGALSPAFLPGTELRKIKSSIVDQEYRISIALPSSFADKDAHDVQYPTIYLLDANWYFGMVTEVTRIVHYCGSFPEVIIVGIGYPVDGNLKESFKSEFGLRARDFTPVANEEWAKRQQKEMSLVDIATGGAHQYLKFIREELIPVVESQYRSDPENRTLAGHSFGGLFALYSLFQATDLFHNYLAASPSLWFGDKAMFSTESDYAQKHSELFANLYLCVGQNEENKDHGMVSDLFRLSAILNSRAYDGLTMKNQVFDNLDHCESVAVGLQFGLKWFFSQNLSKVNE